MLTALGKELRILRIKNGELLKEMAQKLSITPAYLSSIENGKRTPPKNIVSQLVQIYRLDSDYKEKLLYAYFDTMDEVRINIANSSESQKNLGLVFARKFDSLSSKEVDSIMKILNSKGD